MTTLPLRCPIAVPRYALLPLILLGLLPLACVSAPPERPTVERVSPSAAAQEAPSVPGTLKAERGSAVEGELGPGESRELVLTLPSGWYVCWQIQRRERDFSVQLAGPRGEKIASAESRRCTQPG